MISERKLVARWFREGSLQKKVFWTMRQVWEPYVGSYKERGSRETKLFGWRREVARIFVSPKGKEYVRSGPNDPVHLTLPVEGMRPVVLTRLNESAVGRMLDRRAEREQQDERRIRTKKRLKRGARR